MKKAVMMILSVLSLIAQMAVGADFDGDKTGDVAVFRASSGLWAVRGITRAYFGGSGDEPVPGDYRGEGKDRMAIFRSSSGLWAVRSVTRVYFGSSGDSDVPGDLDGNGTDDMAIFRSSSGLWAARGVTRFYFGSSADAAIPPGKGAGPLRLETIVTGQTESYANYDDGWYESGAAFDLIMFSTPSWKITVDNNTGLIWASDGSAKGCCYGQQTDWESAVNWCNNLNFAGSTDWRLPNAKELHSIVDYSRDQPSIDKTKFPHTENGWYWTSTTTDGDGSKAFVFSFTLGNLNFLPEKTEKHYLRAVTGPEL